MTPLPRERFFCITAQRQVIATANHVGKLTCPACGEPVEPVVIKRK